MKSPLTQKQERYTQNLFSGMSQRDAYKDAYHAIYALATIDANASRLAKNVKVLARLKELQEKTEDATVATVLERKQVLTEITRGRFADFIGKGLTEQKLKSAALQEIRVVEFVGGKEGRATQKSTTIKLHNPIQAIAELNKMDGIYREGMTVNIDNRRLEITVSSEHTRELLKEIEEGKSPHGEDNSSISP